MEERGRRGGLHFRQNGQAGQKLYEHAFPFYNQVRKLKRTQEQNNDRTRAAAKAVLFYSV